MAIGQNKTLSMQPLIVSDSSGVDSHGALVEYLACAVVRSIAHELERVLYLPVVTIYTCSVTSPNPMSSH